LANELRQYDIPVDYFYNKSPKMRQQMDYVFKKEIKYMIVIGNDEIINSTINFKVMNEKKEYCINRNSIKDILNFIK